MLHLIKFLKENSLRYDESFALYVDRYFVKIKRQTFIVAKTSLNSHCMAPSSLKPKIASRKTCPLRFPRYRGTEMRKMPGDINLLTGDHLELPHHCLIVASSIAHLSDFPDTSPIDVR